jgi:hypothetical protein
MRGEAVERDPQVDWLDGDEDANADGHRHASS